MFGLSFGINKSNSKSSTNVNKTETVNQQQNDTKTTSGTTTAAGTSNTTSASNTATNQAGTSNLATTGSQNTTSTTKQFDDSVLSGLNSAVGQILGAIPTAPQQLGGSFDHAAFVQGGLDAATSRVNSDLDTSLNGVFDTIGGRDDQNSMATLLANRARGDAAANLAGVRSSLEQTAQGIDESRFGANLSGVKTSQDFLTNVLAQLKGGSATTTGAATTAENQTGATTNAGTSATTGSENTATANVTNQQLVEALNSLLSGTTNTVGTETTKAKGTNIGGGAGLSI